MDHDCHFGQGKVLHIVDVFLTCCGILKLHGVGVIKSLMVTLPKYKPHGDECA